MGTSGAVLVVEDETLILLDLESALEEAGFEVVAAASAEQAIAAFDAGIRRESREIQGPAFRHTARARLVWLGGCTPCAADELYNSACLSERRQRQSVGREGRSKQHYDL